MNKKLISKKLNNLTKPELAILQRIAFAIEVRFYNEHHDKYDDFFKKERFGKIDEFELFRFARILNEDFKILRIEERDGRGFTISFRNHNYDDFLEFKRMVDNELGRDDGTSADEIFRPIKFIDGELSGGLTENKLSIKKENSNEYIVLQKALELPTMCRIDKMSFNDTDDLAFRQIYDTARNLNKKIEKVLKIKDFFKFSYSNKYIMRTV